MLSFEQISYMVIFEVDRQDENIGRVKPAARRRTSIIKNVKKNITRGVI